MAGEWGLAIEWVTIACRVGAVGIRMALGAKRSDVLILMLRETTRPVIAGLVAGMCLAEGASYLLRGVLYGLHRVDSISFAGVSLVFLAIAQSYACRSHGGAQIRLAPTVLNGRQEEARAIRNAQ